MSTLFVFGNTNEHTFGNSIVAANSRSISLFGKPIHDIYVLHTPESHVHLNINIGWRDHLAANGIQSDIITHRTIELSSENAIIRFAKYVESAVASSEDSRIIIDLTNGTTFNKSLLSTVAYILDLSNIYMIDTGKLSVSARQIGFIPIDTLDAAYIKAPDATSLDSIAHLSLTEVLRYRKIIEIQTNRYKDIDSSSCDEVFFRDNLIHSIQMKLRADRSSEKDKALYRIVSSSLTASIEELLRLFLRKSGSDNDNFTFGMRLNRIREKINSVDQKDFDHNFLKHFNDLMLHLRNSATHKGEPLTALESIKADLLVNMSFPFLQFYSEIVLPLLDGNPLSRKIKIQRIHPNTIVSSDILFVGIDGDDTGATLESLFCSVNDEKTLEKMLRDFSENVDRGMCAIKTRIDNLDKKNTVIFASGDDILYRGRASHDFLVELKELYTEKSNGLTCSIGYGKSFREVYIAMKLAKAEPGKNSIVGIELPQ
jgi:hypothetical protein